MLKVFFTGSVRSYKQVRSLYLEIHNILHRLNCELTWDVVKSVDEKLQKNKHSLTEDEWQKIYREMENVLVLSDIAIFENTISAFSTGFLAGIAISKHIPTLVLKNADTQHTFKTSFVFGIDSPYFTVENYRNINDLYKLIESFVKAYSDENKTTSFHLKLSAPEKRFVDRMARKLHIPKLQYIRKLIKDEMLRH